MKAFARFNRLAITCLPLALSLLGCSSQGEGERCDTRNNGSGDCKDGLICNTLVINQGTQGICCPQDGVSSVPACIQGLTQVPVNSDAQSPVEAATAEASDTDASNADASAADAGSDVSAADDSATTDSSSEAASTDDAAAAE